MSKPDGLDGLGLDPAQVDRLRTMLARKGSRPALRAEARRRKSARAMEAYASMPKLIPGRTAADGPTPPLYRAPVAEGAPKRLDAGGARTCAPKPPGGSFANRRLPASDEWALKPRPQAPGRSLFDTLWTDPRHYRGDTRLARTAVRRGWLKYQDECEAFFARYWAFAESVAGENFQGDCRRAMLYIRLAYIAIDMVAEDQRQDFRRYRAEMGYAPTGRRPRQGRRRSTSPGKTSHTP